jgi:hypothetical protein
MREVAMKVWLDDERDPVEWLPSIRWFRGRDAAELGEWVWTKTAPDAIALLDADVVTEMSLDHDLGEETDVGSGYDVLVWIEERVALDETYGPPVIHVHTSNLGARDRMTSAVRSIELRSLGRRGCRERWRRFSR